MKIIKNSPIINSAIKAWNGEEKLWKVFWLWGVLLYTGSIFIGISVMMLGVSLGSVLGQSLCESFFFLLVRLIVELIMFCCGIVVMLIYPTILLFSMNRCSRNTSLNSKKIREVIVFFSNIFPLPFMILHSLFYIPIVYVGSTTFLSTLLLEIKHRNYIISGISLLIFFILFVIFIIKLKKYINYSNIKALNIKSLNSQQNIKPPSKLFSKLLICFMVSIVSIIIILIIEVITSFADSKELSISIMLCLILLSLMLPPLIFILKTCCRKIIISSINKN